MKTFLNMLPWNYRRRELLRLRLLQWSVVWGMGFCLALGLGWAKHTASRNELQVVQAKEKRNAPLQTFKTENEQIRTRLNELNATDTLVVQLQDQPPPLAILGLAGQSARQC